MRLVVRPNRTTNRFRFLEPVHLELKLTNAGTEAVSLDADCLADGRHVAVLVQREGGLARKWRPFGTYCHELRTAALKSGESLYGSHFIGAAADGWLIDEPGFYRVQAAVDVDGLLLHSNVLRLFVSPPTVEAESDVAPDYFSEDVARVLAFQGAPALEGANDVLRKVVERCGANPAATHAAVALSSPMLRNFKSLATGKTRADLAIDVRPKKLDQASQAQIGSLVKRPDAAAETLGHIPYFDTVDRLVTTLVDAGAKKEARDVQEKTVATMERRGVLKSVVDAAKRRLERLK